MTTPTPPPPPPGNQPPPGYQPYAAAGPQPHPKGTTILVLGIVAFFCFGIVLGIIAFVMGTNALKEIDANPQAYTNRGQVQAGRILGIIAAVLNVVGIIYFVAAS